MPRRGRFLPAIGWCDVISQHNGKETMCKEGLTALAGVLVCLLVHPVLAQSSEDYALMAQATWSAFQCSSLASRSSNIKEKERLFLFGYDQGQKFVAAVKAKNVQEKELSDDVRLIVRLMMILHRQGPTDDFMLGRLFEIAERSILEGVSTTGGIENPEETQKFLAQEKFRKHNCHLIGK